MNPNTDGSQLIKLWGNEETDDAVYAVYLKKIRYHNPKIELSEQVSHLEWETVKINVIKAGTLEKLVESFTTDTGELESTYMNIFLSTYRSFTSPSQVLFLVLKRYEEINNGVFQFTPDVKKQHKKTFEKILLVWLEMYPEDFYEPPQFQSLLKIKDLATKYAQNSLLEMRVQHKLSKFKMLENKNEPQFFQPLPFSHIKSILDVPDKEFALQLTFSDSELFKKLVPYQCLGSAWSQRDKHSEWNVSPTTVTATVNQFNAVSLRVISTILTDYFLKPAERAHLITKWINIAQELRLLKNFSSLKAITAALQSIPIHRLRKVWQCVPRDKIEIFSELADIFSEENNQTNCRELLIKEGSAKFVNVNNLTQKQLLKSSEKTVQDYACTMQGTIPYLGTFLTDLTMIDAAIPDYLPNGLINFDKKKKEFAILVQIKLLQSAANSYDIPFNKTFQAWFNSIPTYNDKHSYEISCIIEPPQDTVFHTKRHMFDNVKHSMFKWSHQKSDSTPSASSSGFLCDKMSNGVDISNAIGKSDKKMSKSFSSLSISNQKPKSSVLNGANLLRDSYIIKVSLDDKNCDMGGINVYKSILLNNNDRTRTVITNAMQKHGIEDDPESYSLIQLLDGGEIPIPDSANVYYAVNPNYELKFVLRLRKKNEPKRKKRISY